MDNWWRLAWKVRGNAEWAHATMQPSSTWKVCITALCAYVNLIAGPLNSTGLLVTTEATPPPSSACRCLAGADETMPTAW